MRHFVWRVSYRALAVIRQSMSTESTLLQKWGSVVLWISNFRGRVYMPTRVLAKKKAKAPASKARSKTSKTISKKSATASKNQKKSAPKRTATKKSGTKRSAKGILTRAKEALKTVIVGAASGAAEGAVTGAAEAGSKVAGVGPATKEEGSDKSKAQAAGKK